MALDELARFNQERWEALVAANIEYARPWLDLDVATARQRVDPYGFLGDVRGRPVLCLASGGGQQSAALALLGANVTVFDLSPTQLARDRQAAAHYGHRVTTIQGDMRNLSALDEAAFDMVWHAHSANFVPDIRPVIAGVSRVLRPGGLYRTHVGNPFVVGLDERDWTGDGYPLRRRYEDGEVTFADPHWDVYQPDGSQTRVLGPREFRHTLNTVIGALAGHGLVILGVWEELSQENAAAPGSWEHYKSIAPPWLEFWCRYRPDAFAAGW